MSLTAIIILILLGLVLLILEILFVPGMVLGFISVILMLVGVIFAFKDHGNTVGWSVLGGTSATAIASVFWAFNSKTWQKLGVQSSIDSKANVIEEGSVKAGDKGKTISRLNPIGKAFINGKTLEVQAHDGFVDENADVIIVSIRQNKIIVKPINNIG